MVLFLLLQYVQLQFVHCRPNTTEMPGDTSGASAEGPPPGDLLDRVIEFYVSDVASSSRDFKDGTPN